MPVLMQEREKTAAVKKERVSLLDFLRGTAMIYVMFYHLAYDLVYYAEISVPFWRSAWFEALHTVILALLFSVSGICTAFSRDPVKRGAVIFFMGTLLTFFTELFMPYSVIVFGVLSFFGVMMMLTGIIRPLTDKANPWVSAAVLLALYVMFFDFASEGGTVHLIFADVKIPLPDDRVYLYPLGITHSGFFSADYFPLIPNGFIYLAGAAVSRAVKEHRLPAAFYAEIKAPVINFLGKHSLAFYIIHQPVFLGLTFLLMKLRAG